MLLAPLYTVDLPKRELGVFRLKYMTKVLFGDLVCSGTVVLVEVARLVNVDEDWTVSLISTYCSG